MRKLAFLCVIVLVVFVVGCSIGREDLFELAGSVIPDDGSVTEVGEPSVDPPVDPPIGPPIPAPEIRITSSSGIEIPVNDPYQFPVTEAFAYTTQTFIVENIGDAALVLTDSVIIDGIEISTEFTTDYSALILLPGEVTTFDVTLRYAAAVEDIVSIQGVMVLGSNDEDEFPYVIFLRATITAFTASAPWIDVMIEYATIVTLISNDDDYFIPDTSVGGEASVINVTVSNFGNDDLILGNVLMTGKPGTFIIGLPMEITIAPAGFTTFQVAFRPNETKTYSQKLKINSNDPDIDRSSFSVTLTGTGVWE